MTFRSRLVLATTAAVVVAVVASCSAAFVVARNTLLNAADNSLTTAAQKIVAGQEIGSTTATLGQVIDTGGAVVSGGGLPVTGQVRLVSVGLAPSFFTTVNVDGNEIRELVEHLPGEHPVQSGTLVDGRRPPDRHAAQCRIRAEEAGPLSRRRRRQRRRPGRGPRLPRGSHHAGAAELADRHGGGPGRDHRRHPTPVSPGGSDELGRLRRTFNRLLEALESSRRAQSRLVLDASHELRTPLTSLRTNLEVIRRVDELSDEDRSVLVDDVLVQLQELTDIVGDLAELARGDQTPAPAELLRLDLLVSDAVVVANTHGRADDVSFEFEAEPCWVDAHADRLPRAVGNLLDNARKWSPPGQPVSVECADGTVVVRDRGPGIAEDDLPRIFDRFYRSPAARRLARVGSGSGHRGPGGQGGGGHRHGGERPGRRGPHDHAPPDRARSGRRRASSGLTRVFARRP